MSAEEQRRLLEALMGKQALHGSKAPKVHFSDPSGTFPADNLVCKDFLCGLCPNDLFLNTKMDIGSCKLQHSDRLRADYEAEKAAGKHAGYENDWALSLNSFIDECDRKSQQTLKKMDKVTLEDPKATQLIREKSDIEYEVLVVLEQCQTVGEEGNIEEAIRLLHIVQYLQDRLAHVVHELKLIEVGAGATQTQKLRLCYRCSASLSIFDSDRRLADHFIGKMHVGFVKLRKKLEELKAAGFGVVNSTVERGSNDSYRRRDRDSFRDRGRRYDQGRRSPPRGRNY